MNDQLIFRLKEFYELETFQVENGVTVTWTLQKDVQGRIIRLTSSVGDNLNVSY